MTPGRLDYGYVDPTARTHRGGIHSTIEAERESEEPIAAAPAAPAPALAKPPAAEPVEPVEPVEKPIEHVFEDQHPRDSGGHFVKGGIMDLLTPSDAQKDAAARRGGGGRGKRT